MNTESTATCSELTPGSLRGKLLISMPGMDDPAFSHTLVYICDHSQEGAMGVVVNRPMRLAWGEVFEQLQCAENPRLGGRAVLQGGPVQPERGLVIHPAGSRWDSTLEINARLSVTGSRDIIQALADGRGPDRALLALGYAGWEAGQLEGEMATNAWLIADAEPELLFEVPVEQRWQVATQQLGFDVNLLPTEAGHA